jgi:hypothetical protein
VDESDRLVSGFIIAVAHEPDDGFERGCSFRMGEEKEGRLGKDGKEDKTGGSELPNAGDEGVCVAEENICDNNNP